MVAAGANVNDWSQLPTDLVVSIMERLTHGDFIRFGAAYTVWNAVRKANLCRPAEHLPWLMFSAASGSNDGAGRSDGGVTHSFFDMSTNKDSKVCLPEEMNLRQCIGTSTDGRLVVYMGHDLELRMLNLQTREHLDLPPLATLWDITGITRDAGTGRAVKYLLRMNLFPDSVPKSQKYLSRVFFRKAIVFPGFGPLIVAFLHGTRRSVSVARVGDEAWTRLDCPEDFFGITDIVLHKGRLCAVDFKGNTMAWTLRDPSSFSWSNAQPLASRIDDTSIFQKYLVPLAECSDEVFQVWRDEGNELDPITLDLLYCTTPQVKVFKLDVAKDTWVEAEDLAGHTFFLGFNYSIVLSANELVDHTRLNCIYFTEHDLWMMTYNEMIRHHARDIAVFNLKDGTCEPLNPSPSGVVVNFPSPIWVDSRALQELKTS